jgi:hypothetical protein
VLDPLARERKFIDGLNCASYTEADLEDVFDNELVDCCGPSDDGAVVDEIAYGGHLEIRE